MTRRMFMKVRILLEYVDEMDAYLFAKNTRIAFKEGRVDADEHNYADEYLEATASLLEEVRRN